MSITYIVETNGAKGNRKTVWTDTGKTARITRNIPSEYETRFFENRPPTLDEAVRIADIYRPYRTGLPKGAEVTFLEPVLHLDEQNPYFTVRYVEARR